MKSSAKRMPLYTALMFVISLLCATVLAIVLMPSVRVAADDEADNDSRFYYAELKNSPLAQKFYDLFEELAANGSFNDGQFEYDLTSILSEADLNDYIVNGSSKIPVAFGAARDAFYMDHPEIFYVDVYKMYVTAGTQNGETFMKINAGRADNYYLDNSFTSATQVTQAVSDFDRAVTAAVNDIKANSSDVVAQIRNTNAYIMENVEYDLSYGATQKPNGDIEYNGNVNTAYGALVEGKALCGGYSRAFKVIMDKLGIPCVLVQGVTNTGVLSSQSESGFSAHMWNAVEVGGMWYAVDVTFNDGHGNPDRYTLVGDDVFSVNHFEDGVISSSGFELKYPALRPLDYGVNEDESGFEFKDDGELEGIEFGYITTASDPDNYTLYLGVSYNGKNADELKEEGLYLVVRTAVDGPWVVEDAINEFYLSNTGLGLTVDKYTFNMWGNNAAIVQFAIVDYAPDCDLDNVIGPLPLPNSGYANLTSNHILAVSTVYTNRYYGNRSTPPYITKMIPDEKGYISVLDPVDISITYDEELVYVDEHDTTVGINVISSSGYAETEVSNVVWNAQTNTVSFRFAPSKQYSHDCETYSFAPTNLVGKTSGKAPDMGSLSFRRKSVVCPKVFNDGRLYMQLYGEPQFVSASDESTNQFKGPDGQPLVGNQRSQLMLVINEPTQAESAEMMDAAQEEFGLDDGDIMSSVTYQIDLHVCGFLQSVPAGSYMQVGFGFPKGYGPEDAGITFTVYHYTRNPDGTIDEVQEVPCVVTECGIIATVKSFSPFMICAIDSSKASGVKNVYATVDGAGGKVENAEIRQVAAGESVSFKLVKDAGYDYDNVLLNGVDVKSKVGADGTLTLSYEELTGVTIGDITYASSNVLEVTFISERVAQYNAQNGITVISPKIVVKDGDMIEAVYGGNETPAPTPGGEQTPSVDPVGGNDPDGTNVGLIVGIVIAVVAVLAACGVALYFILRKKKVAAETAAIKPTKTTAAKSQTKSNASKTVKTNTSNKTQNKNGDSARNNRKK